MQWIVRAEWISYDRTSIRNGTVAKEFSASQPMADYTADIWLVEADSKEDAILLVGTPWEVWPTNIVAYEPTIRGIDKRVVHIGTERAPYWRYKPQTQKDRTGKLQSYAQNLLRNHDFDINSQVDTKALAPIMAAATNCHHETAKRHLVKAARIMRGESVASRGGKREGAGRPSAE